MLSSLVSKRIKSKPRDRDEEAPRDRLALYQHMIEATHTPEAPWHIVPADDKRRTRLNLIRHLLDSIPYKRVHIGLPEIPKAQPRPKGATERLGAGPIWPRPRSLLTVR